MLLVTLFAISRGILYPAGEAWCPDGKGKLLLLKPALDRAGSLCYNEPKLIGKELEI